MTSVWMCAHATKRANHWFLYYCDFNVYLVYYQSFLFVIFRFDEEINVDWWLVVTLSPSVGWQWMAGCFTRGTAQFSRQTYTWTSELLTIVQLQGRLELTDFHHLLLIMMFWMETIVKDYTQNCLAPATMSSTIIISTLSIKLSQLYNRYKTKLEMTNLKNFKKKKRKTQKIFRSDIFQRWARLK